MAALDGINRQPPSSFYNNYDLTRGQSIGLALIVEASLISGASVMGILIWIGWNLRWYRRMLPNGDWKLFQWPADIYMFSLFLFDFVQAIGGILDVRWAHNGTVTTGPYCTAQGIIQQTGELGSALITFILATHTFVTVMWRVGLRARGFACCLVGLVWIFVALWVGIGAGIHKNYETPTPYWCWIGPQYTGERIGGEYAWLWVALFTSVILYVPLYFWAKGRLSVDEEKWYKFRTSRPDRGGEYAQRRAALGMLLYPIVYSFVILPVSISRWLEFSNKSSSSAATFFGVSMHNLSGAINVLLTLVFKPQLLLLTRPDQSDVEHVHVTSSALFSGTAEYEHSPQPTATRLMDGNSGNSATPSRISTGRRSDDI
ncbi:hypothetical protein BJV74DRAFT_131271 [Russula compacta]|nr:hypothetical protein BJV74DRAFT_131271 [Russula compacta]